MVTDNGSNVKKAFSEKLSLPGFEIEVDESDDELDENDSEMDTDSHKIDCDESFSIPQRISCFAHTLQLCIKDGFKSCTQISKVLMKSACIVNHVKKSILATDRLDQLYGKTLVAKNETRWNSQLKMVRRLLEIDVEKVVEKQDLLLTSYEKSILRELVDILEPFEDATDLLQGELYNSISLVIPSFLGLKKHLTKVSVKYCNNLVRALKSSLEQRLEYAVDDPLYICGAMLDPRFKLKWCDVENHQSYQEDELLKLCPAVEVIQPPFDDESEAPPAKKTKFDKLFGFMNTSFKPQAPQDNTQEVQRYLSDTTELENALQFWKVKEKEFPALSCLVKKIFSVPATSAPIERVFSQSGKILAPLRSRLKPKNLETLVFLKLNSKYI